MFVVGTQQISRLGQVQNLLWQSGCINLISMPSYAVSLHMPMQLIYDDHKYAAQTDLCSPLVNIKYVV